MKCTICRCTDKHACDSGCSWATTNPPICSRCDDNMELIQEIIYGFTYQVENTPSEWAMVDAAGKEIKKPKGAKLVLMDKGVARRAKGAAKIYDVRES